MMAPLAGPINDYWRIGQELEEVNLLGRRITCSFSAIASWHGPASAASSFHHFQLIRGCRSRSCYSFPIVVICQQFWTSFWPFIALLELVSR